jgi:hypothetical protein
MYLSEKAGHTNRSRKKRKAPEKSHKIHEKH